LSKVEINFNRIPDKKNSDEANFGGNPNRGIPWKETSLEHIQVGMRPLKKSMKDISEDTYGGY
jgi:hypothetical protein